MTRSDPRADRQSPNQPGYALRRIASEPLLHFLLLGGLLWTLYPYLQAPRERPRIIISKAKASVIAEHYRQQYGAIPTPPQLDSLIDTAITDEIFYRAAIELGLDRDDEIVRRRLIQKYQFLQQDLLVPEPPSEAALRNFYDRHPERYRSPERVTFTHAYFSPDRWGDAGAREAAQRLASTLNTQKSTRAADQGDRFPGPRDLVALSPHELARVFGEEGLAADVFTSTLGHWSAPLRSGFGWHTVYLIARDPARALSFDDVRDRVSGDYLDAEQGRINRVAIEALRGRFEIVRE